MSEKAAELKDRVNALSKLSGLDVSIYTKGNVNYFVFGPSNKPLKTICTYRKSKVFAEGIAMGRQMVNIVQNKE